MFSLFLLFNGLSGSWDMARYGWHIPALLSLQNNILIRYEGLVSLPDDGTILPSYLKNGRLSYRYRLSCLYPPGILSPNGRIIVFSLFMVIIPFFSLDTIT